MKPGRIIALVIALLLLVALMPKACAQVTLPHRHSVSVSSSVPVSCGWLTQGFEGPGYDNAETWTTVGATDPDSTAVVLDGLQSLTTTNNGYAWASFCSTNEVYVYFMLRPRKLEYGNFRSIVYLLPQTNDFTAPPLVQCAYTIGSGSTAKMSAGDSISTDNTVGTITESTTYHIWFHYKAGTGVNNGIADVGFSTDGIRPTTGNNFVQKTDLAITNYVRAIALGRTANGANTSLIFDKLRVRNTVIGNNGE